MAEDPVLARIPKAARAETPEGAEAFVKFYFAQLNSAFRKADPGAVQPLASKTCKICNAMLEGVKDVQAKNQRYDRDLITVRAATVMDFVSTNRRVLAEVQQNPVKILDADDQVIETAQAGPGNYVLSLEYTGHWKVSRLQEAG